MFPVALPPQSSAFEHELTVINEDHISCFDVHLGYGLTQAMCYQNDLYGLVAEVDYQQQSQAYNLACTLVADGGTAIVSVNHQQYRVWVSLRVGVGLPFAPVVAEREPLAVA